MTLKLWISTSNQMKIEIGVPKIFKFIKDIVPKFHAILIWVFFQQNAIVGYIKEIEVFRIESFKIKWFTTRQWISVSTIEKVMIKTFDEFQFQMMLTRT